ncbi:MAG: hypothetical protein H0Z35_13575 [Thermoanaerobacteraceae bacterium]|nr:hypothetical protein [Thermoanaerobacteraceae bacterium]
MVYYIHSTKFILSVSKKASKEIGKFEQLDKIAIAKTFALTRRSFSMHFISRKARSTIQSCLPMTLGFLPMEGASQRFSVYWPRFWPFHPLPIPMLSTGRAAFYAFSYCSLGVRQRLGLA